MSLRDTILGADDLEELTMDIPEWDVTILLKGMSAGQRVRVRKLMKTETPESYADILILALLDPDTKKTVFDPADRDALAAKSGAVLERIALEWVRISGPTDEEAEAEIEADPTSGGV
jgi:hypothetical protein